MILISGASIKGKRDNSSYINLPTGSLIPFLLLLISTNGHKQNHGVSKTRGMKDKSCENKLKGETYLARPAAERER